MHTGRTRTIERGSDPPSPTDPYQPIDGSYDEMVDATGARRSHWENLGASLDTLGTSELADRSAEAARMLDSHGVSYHQTTPLGPGSDLGPGSTPCPGGAEAVADRWRLDPVPVVISNEEWRSLEPGLEQRAHLLDLVLTDLYGPRRLIADGLVPPEVVFGHPGFLRACDGVTIPGRHQLFLVATDLARDADGRRVALADRTQAPSGAAYALENRTVVSRVFPGVYRDNSVQRLAPFFRALRSSLRQVAPPTTDTPRIVVLSPGPRSETAFEHAMLAANLGCPLVQGADLRVRDGRVWMRTLGRLVPVHVILRRVDAAFCDPLELRPESHLGVPGLIEASRLGNVSIVNTLGSGVLENPALAAFLPAVADALLGEPLSIRPVTAWWCGDRRSLSHVIANLDRLVLKSLSAGADESVVLGAELSRAELDGLRNRILAEPISWVGEEPVNVGSVPTLIDGGVEPRRAILRTFAVANGDGYRVMPGGLTRVATDPATAVITNQTGALSKDTWVLSDEPELLTGFWLQSGPMGDTARPEATTSARAAENLFWLSRYAERTESLVRLLRVVSDRRNEFPTGTNPAGSACLDVLLMALTRSTDTQPGFVGEGGDERRSNPDAELRSLVSDGDRAGTLAFDVARLLDAAAEVRDQLSTDTWLVIGHLDRDLAALRGRFGGGDSQWALGRVMGGMLALSGLAAESMVRDPGWQFMGIGRRIERSLQLCSLLGATLDTTADAATDSLVLESTLTVAESIITYRRRYRGRARVETVLDLLISDADNPRSLIHQLERLDEHLSALPGASQDEPTSAQHRVDAALALASSIDTAAVATVTSGGDRPALRSLLNALASELAGAAADLEAEHFTRQLPQLAVFTPADPGWG